MGVAGSGKSFLLGAARDAWEAAGYRVKGAALSGIVAQSLQVEAGIEESRTIASWTHRWGEDKNHLGPRDVLVIDEAGLIGTRQMDCLLSEASASSAKVVMVGDSQQLQAIEAGAAFRGICQQAGYVELDGVRRQEHDWQKQATKDFAKGKTKKALDAYHGYRQILFNETKCEAIDALTCFWKGRRDEKTSQVILAHTRADVALLNESVRNALKEDKRLGLGCMAELQNGTKELSPGEEVVFLKNNTALGVKNGTRGVVVDMGIGGDFGVKISPGKTVYFNTEEYNHLDYGYALTIHKAQGLTVDKAYVYASRGMDKHLSYVSLSRHKEKVTLFADNETFRDYADLAHCLSRNGEKDLIQDYANIRHLSTEKSLSGDFMQSIRGNHTPAEKGGLERLHARITLEQEVSRLRTLHQSVFDRPLVARSLDSNERVRGQHVCMTTVKETGASFAFIQREREISVCKLNQSSHDRLGESNTRGKIIELQNAGDKQTLRIEHERTRSLDKAFYRDNLLDALNLKPTEEKQKPAIEKTLSLQKDFDLSL